MEAMGISELNMALPAFDPSGTSLSGGSLQTRQAELGWFAPVPPRCDGIVAVRSEECMRSGHSSSGDPGLTETISPVAGPGQY